MSEKERIIALLEGNRNTKGGTRLSATVKYTVSMDGDTTAVLPPQAIQLVGILIENEGPWNEIELHELIQGYTEISEKQQPWQIFKYYRKKLIDSGWLVMTK